MRRVQLIECLKAEVDKVGARERRSIEEELALRLVREGQPVLNRNKEGGKQVDQRKEQRGQRTKARVQDSRWKQ